MELEANEETSFVKLLAINNFSSHGRPLVDRINLYLISRPPTADRAHSHAARTEIIGVGLFFDLAAPRLEGREPHGDHDGEPLFASAGQVFVRRHTIHAAEAMTGQGRRSLGRTKLNQTRLKLGPSVESDASHVRRWTVDRWRLPRLCFLWEVTSMCWRAHKKAPSGASAIRATP